MKKTDLERHLRKHGCIFLEEGGKHSKWMNPINHAVTTVPRHNEIDFTSPKQFVDNYKLK